MTQNLVAFFTCLMAVAMVKVLAVGQMLILGLDVSFSVCKS